MKLKDIFEDKILTEEYKILPKRKKTIDGSFEKKFFIMKNKNETLGRKMGYASKEEAIKDLLYLKDNKFRSLSIVKQKEKINRYIKRHKL
jgi:hypothetical protein